MGGTYDLEILDDHLQREAELRAVEAASDTLLEPVGFWPLPDLPEPPEPERVLVVIVAGTPAVGFVRVAELDGAAHIAQISVHPDHGRRAIGTGLMVAAERWAAERGYQVMTLTTFADVAFNAPWYQKLGYRELRPVTTGLMATVERERPLEALGRRIVMAKALSVDPADE